MKRVLILLVIGLIIVLCVSCTEDIKVYDFTVNPIELGNYDSVYISAQITIPLGIKAFATTTISPGEMMTVQSYRYPEYTAKGVKDGVVSDMGNNSLVIVSIR